MRFLILSTDEPDFEHWLFRRHPDWPDMTYQEQQRVRNLASHGLPDGLYTRALESLGHEAHEVVVNSVVMQRRWGVEAGVRGDPPRRLDAVAPHAKRAARSFPEAVGTPWVRIKDFVRPIIRPSSLSDADLRAMLFEQVMWYRPDVLYIQSMRWISPDFLRVLRRNVRLVVGQIASPLPAGWDLSGYDLVFSSLPNLVERFRREGCRAEELGLGFDPDILRAVPAGPRDIALSFVGSVGPWHRARVATLERVARDFPLRIWGVGAEELPSSSPLRACYEGRAYGIEMFEILRRSALTLNQHIDMADQFANNQRLYEATGMGACLVTDHKINLADIFDLDREVRPYRDPEDCCRAIAALLEDHALLAATARAGQRRTVQDHTIAARMQQATTVIAELLV